MGWAGWQPEDSDTSLQVHSAMLKYMALLQPGSQSTRMASGCSKKSMDLWAVPDRRVWLVTVTHCAFKALTFM